MALFGLGALVALGFLQDLSKENRALIIIASSIGILACFLSLIFISAFRKWLRKRIWLRAMSAWNESSRARNAPNFVLPIHSSETELRYLAIQIYSWMGYQITNRGAKEQYLRLINPEGRIELVACNQQADLTELHHVHSLQLEMKRTKAARGFFWAPAGFTSEATSWAVHRSIILADLHEIGRFVDCAQSKGSRFLQG
jgi:hypothetical protein